MYMYMYIHAGIPNLHTCTYIYIRTDIGIAVSGFYNIQLKIPFLLLVSIQPDYY